MERHDSQERTGVGSSRTVSSPPPLGSSPSGYTLCPSKRRHVLTSESPSPRNGSVVTTILGVFDGRSNSVYKNWMQSMHPSPDTHEYVSFVNKKVVDHDNGVWTTGTVQCLHKGIVPSMMHILSGNIILPNKSQPFPIVWADDTDSICDIPFLLTYVDNFESNRHKDVFVVVVRENPLDFL